MSAVVLTFSIIFSLHVQNVIDTDYRVVDTHFSICNARISDELCKQKIPNSRLASIHNETQYDLALAVLMETGQPYAWIGLQNDGNQWKWSDNSTFNFGTNLSGGVFPWDDREGPQPSDCDPENSGNKCCTFFYSFHGGGWYDVNFTGGMYSGEVVLCEVFPTDAPTTSPTNVLTTSTKIATPPEPADTPPELADTPPPQLTSKDETTWEKYAIALIVGGILIFVFCIAFLIYKHVTKEKSIHISDVLVAIISIEFYNTSDEIKKEIDANCDDLAAVSHDMNNLKQLFKALNYTVMTNNDKMEWNASEIKQFLENDVVNELISDRKQYDGIIIAISSHGLRDNIITSEYEKVDKTAIHRMISKWRIDEKHKQIRDLPRCFIFDCCSGNNSRQMTTDITEMLGEEQKKGVDEKNENTDIPKGIEYAPVENEWAWSDANPDYNTILVDAANIGFQAFSDTSKGSYLITCFVEKVKQCLENHNYVMNKPLINIFEEIQYELHKRGKQLIQINSSGKMIKRISLKRNNNKNDMYMSMSDLVKGGRRTLKSKESYSQCLDMDETGKQNLNDNHKPSIVEMKNLERLKSTAL